ncbi:MAG: hypothetical protein IJP61_07315 [Treponema sp.]|nr:hypothetical protein [Treponema sp.]
MTESEAKTLVEQHRKAGDLIEFCSAQLSKNIKDFDNLYANLKKNEIEELEKNSCNKTKKNLKKIIDIVNNIKETK